MTALPTQIALRVQFFFRRNGCCLGRSFCFVELILSWFYLKFLSQDQYKIGYFCCYLYRELALQYQILLHRLVMPNVRQYQRHSEALLW